jgi:hypothetical protein
MPNTRCIIEIRDGSMNVIPGTTNFFTIEVNDDKYLFLYNYINEFCNDLKINDVEFQTRLGVPRDISRDFLNALSSVFPFLIDLSRHSYVRQEQMEMLFVHSSRDTGLFQMSIKFRGIISKYPFYVKSAIFIITNGLIVSLFSAIVSRSAGQFLLAFNNCMRFMFSIWCLSCIFYYAALFICIFMKHIRKL